MLLPPFALIAASASALVAVDLNLTMMGTSGPAGAAVAVGGTAVAVGGTLVAVGGTDVAVDATAFVAVEVTVGVMVLVGIRTALVGTTDEEGWTVFVGAGDGVGVMAIMPVEVMTLKIANKTITQADTWVIPVLETGVLRGWLFIDGLLSTADQIGQKNGIGLENKNPLSTRAREQRVYRIPHEAVGSEFCNPDFARNSGIMAGQGHRH
jgi:hypothetical protein